MSGHIQPTQATVDRLCRLMRKIAGYAQDALQNQDEELYLFFLDLINDLLVTKDELLEGTFGNSNGS